MNRLLISQESMSYKEISASIQGAGKTVDQTLSINGGVNVHSSTKGTSGLGDFFSMLDEIWNKLLMLAKQLRDTMKFYNQKKQELSWGLEINALNQNLKAIDDSYTAAKLGAIGGMCAGTLGLGGAFFGSAGMTVGSAMGQIANSIAGTASASETRKADAEKAIAELQNKGAQAYAKTLDDTLMKAREIMQQMMDWGNQLVEVFNRVLHAISR